MDSAKLEVHSIINRNGRKLLVINHNTYRKVRFTYRGNVLWKCTRKYCPASVCTENFEDNIVTFAKFNHQHDDFFRNNRNNRNNRNKRGLKRKYMDDCSECSLKTEDSFGTNEGSTADEEVNSDFNEYQAIKKEKEELDEIEADTISSSEFAPNNLNEIRFPYMELNEYKVEIAPGVWIFDQILDFVKNSLQMNPAGMIKELLWYLIGPNNLKYMSLIGCEANGTIRFPQEIYFVVQLFVAENCSEDSQLSLKDFIQCIEKTFKEARDFTHKKSQENSENQHKRQRLYTGEH